MPDDVDHLFRTILSSWKEIHGLNGPYVPPIVTDPKELQDSCAPRKFDHGTPASRREGR
ncbi:hypothetical protein HOA55_04720 [archaeon]|nr:hypothetical protein [archaeon]MBT6820633.1 hypothetical protein [archaeon]MBT7024957.1 hypothetical protein [archaeon]